MAYSKVKLVHVCLIALIFHVQEVCAKTAPLSINWVSSIKHGRTAVKKKLSFATPLVAGDKVFVGSFGSYFCAVNLANGKKIWEKKLEGPIETKAVIDGEALYLGDGEGYVYSINPATGEIIWQVYVGEEVMASPVVDRDMVFIATQNNSVFALDKSTGAIKWMATRPQPFSLMTMKGYSDPVIIDGKLYVGNTDGVLVVYDVRDGRKLMTYPVAAARALFTDIDTRPERIDKRLIFSSMEGVLTSIELNTGKEAWVLPIATPNNITLDSENIYVTGGGKLYRVNAHTGDKVWERGFDDVGELSQAVVVRDYVAVASTEDKLYLVNKSDGSVIYERHLGGGAFGAPVASDGKLLIFSNSGQLYAFRIN